MQLTGQTLAVAIAGACASTSVMALGTVALYVFGSTWLAYDLGVPVASGETNAISLGVTPFLVGDLLKLVLAGVMMPAVWAIVDRARR